MWIQERKAKNGDIRYRFMERYKDPLTGKARNVSATCDKNTTHTRKAATAELQRKIADKLNKPTKINELDPDDITLKQLVVKYLEYQFIDENGIKKATYSRNMHAYYAFVRILGADTKIVKLNQNYVADKFRETGEGNGTLNERLTRFKALIRWGYEKDYIADIKWLDKLKRFKDKPHRFKIEDKFLEANEVRQLLDGMEIERWRLLTHFMILSGLRIGEAVALTNDDVDINNSIIHVNTTYDSVNDLITTPKNGETRDVYIQPELAKVCKKIKQLMLEQKIQYGYEKSDFFFTNEKGRNIEYYAYNKYLKSRSSKILGREITTHFLRHTSASLLMEAGIQIDNISQRLGHSNSKVTREIYLHITEKLKEKYNQQIAKVKIF
ncbi:MAG: site-specific integrase [Lachnospiraceae bacterium]|nr:site-specific integrase [Lachnospiraceae bacterium]